MNLSTKGVLATTFLALALAGCQSDRFSGFDSRSRAAPAPLPAAPSGPVTAGQLPPPAQPGVTDPSQFPAPPGGAAAGTGTPGADTQVAALEQNAADITTGSVAGVWNAN